MLRSLSALVVPAAAVLAGLTVLTAAPGATAAVSRPDATVSTSTASASTASASTASASTASSLVSDPAALVNPMIGTGSGGASVGQIDTFPGASAPFGMLTFSPDTPSRPDGGGYNYADSSIMGFSLTHLSGPGCGADGDFPILPSVGSIGADPVDSTEPFSHSEESASPGSYGVTLDPGTSDAIKSDLAATTRTGIGTFTYPSTTAANMLFKIGDS